MSLPFWESGGLQRIGSSASRWICFLYDIPSSGITMFVDLGSASSSIFNEYIWSVPSSTSVVLGVQQNFCFLFPRRCQSRDETDELGALLARVIKRV